MSEVSVTSADTPPSPRSREAIRHSWVERLARFARSGLRPAQFCANEGISLPSFYAWKRRLAAAAAPADAPRPHADAEPRLLPVRLPAANAAIELVLPTGAVLRLLPGCDLAFVRALLVTLGDEPC
jgi:hypothetical protein